MRQSATGERSEPVASEAPLSATTTSLERGLGDVKLPRMVWAWILIAAASILFVWFWRWGSEPVPIRFTDPGTMRQALRWVLLRGVYRANVKGTRGALRIVIGTSTRPFLVFTKEQYGEGTYGVVATIFPDGLRPEVRPRIRTALTAKGFGVQESPHEDGFVIDVREDYGKALALLQTLCRDVAGVNIDDGCMGYLRDVLPMNKPSLTGVDASNEELFK